MISLKPILKSFCIITFWTNVASAQSELFSTLRALEEPTLANAKNVVAALEELDVSTSPSPDDLAARIKDLFTAEFKLEIAINKSRELETEAEEWNMKAEQWLIPNAFGRVNQAQANSAKKKAAECLTQSEQIVKDAKDAIVPTLRQFNEVIFELYSSGDYEAVVVLVNVMTDIRKRSAIEDLFTPSFGPQFIEDLRTLVENRDQWIDEGRKAEESGNFLAAILLYHKAKDLIAYRRAASAHATHLENKGFYGSAVDYFNLAGNHESVARIKKEHPEIDREDFTEMNAEELFSTVSPKVVRIRSQSRESKSLGSGFFIWPGGFILTNNHVVNGAKKIIVVTNDNTQHEATLLASSTTPDLALLQIQLEDHGVVTLGSDIEVKTGMNVALIGFPILDLSTPTLNTGRISNTDRSFSGNPVFQLDVSANHGNSGGPVVDSYGRLVGVMTFGLGDQDIDRFNFAIKNDVVREFLRQKLPTGFK